MFVTKPQTLLVNEGDTIRLPCYVDRLEGFVMLWKRNKDIITVGHQIVDKNVRLEETDNGSTLVIGPASPDDEAVRCDLAKFEIISNLLLLCRTTPVRSHHTNHQRLCTQSKLEVRYNL